MSNNISPLVKKFADEMGYKAHVGDIVDSCLQVALLEPGFDLCACGWPKESSQPCCEDCRILFAEKALLGPVLDKKTGTWLS